MRGAAVLLVAVLLTGCTGTGDTAAPAADGDTTMTSLTLSSPAFDEMERIPDRYGYEEENVNPPLTIENVPDGAASLALVMDDPDAEPVAGKVWDHWVLYSIPPTVSEIREGAAPGIAGQNDYGEPGYGGPNPPDGEHTYVFTVYALDTELDLDPGATKAELESVIDGHVIEKDVLRGTYAP